MSNQRHRWRYLIVFSSYWARVAQSKEMLSVACTRYGIVPGSDSLPSGSTKPSTPRLSLNRYQACLGSIKRWLHWLVLKGVFLDANSCRMRFTPQEVGQSHMHPFWFRFFCCITIPVASKKPDGANSFGTSCALSGFRWLTAAWYVDRQVISVH